MDERPHYERGFYKRMYQAGVFALAERLTRIFGRGVANFVAGNVAAAYAATQHGVTETVRQNLELLTTDPLPNSRARTVFRNFGRTIADYIYVGTRPRDEAARLCIELTGREGLEKLSREGCGAILATAHLGFFEFGALVLGEMGLPVTVVTLSEPTPDLTKWRADYRSRWGAKTIEMGADSFSALQVVHELQAARFTAMLVDRPFGPRSIPVAAPNGTVRFSASPAIVSLLSGAPIVPVAVTSTASGKYRLQADDPIYPERLPEGRDASIDRMTRRMGTALLAMIGESPEQWYQFVPIDK